MPSITCPLSPHHPLLMRESAQRRALKKWEGIEANAAKPESREWAARNAAALREMLAETETLISAASEAHEAHEAAA